MNGRMYLKFKDPEIGAAFIARRQNLIDSYADLLAFQDVFKKLEKIYDTDLTYHIADRLRVLRENIEQNNRAIRIATNTDEESMQKKYGRLLRWGTLKLKDDLLIDVDTIQPDQQAVEVYAEKLKKILGEL